MARRKTEDNPLFTCTDACEQMPWEVEGRYNAHGEFESYDHDDRYCPNCGADGAPANDIVVAR